MAGFFAKLLILAHLMEVGLYSVAFVVILASVISVCNYLSLVQTINAWKAPTGRRGAPGYAEGLTVKYQYAVLLAYLVGVVLVESPILSNVTAFQPV